MAKGGEYERDFCRQLSLWWTSGVADEWFWRASQSGGRATTRAKAGKSTVGHCGDVAPCCPLASVLTDFITWELKRGYNTKAFLADLLDRVAWPTDPKLRKDTILGMIEQAMAAADRAKTPHWALVHRRDKRESVIYLPRGLAYRLLPEFVAPIVDLVRRVGRRDVGIVVVQLGTFFKEVKPATVRQLAEVVRNGK